MRAPDKAAGHKAKCPKCGTAVLVPNSVDNALEYVDEKRSTVAVPVALLVIRREELPGDLRGKPNPDETIHHFGYIDAKGGCANPSTAKQWILVTNKRILFEASVKEGTGATGKYVHQSGSIPMSKVSYVGTATTEEQQGCAQVKVRHLRISSGGGDIILAIPTKEEAQQAQEVIDGILSQAR
jgi:hypothetical protein